MNRRMNPNIEILNSVCWDYDIDANNVYNILKTKDDKDSPISFDTLRYKVLKYISVESLKTIFLAHEIKSIFSDINLKKIRNPQTKSFLATL